MRTAPTKSVKVTDYSHKWLKVASAKSGQHVYRIIDSLVHGLTGGALYHAAYRNHDFKPESCDGCAEIERLIHVKNGSKKERR